ncbi:hypothetical protein FQP81_15385 [Pseudoalteromonas distincta]|uniref:hypothetical protein n=1 Tax=Pseudoalteromonas distincta TaxID=77608 RepID=UPI00119305EE|nr:hypothetical protein [Pseudoalteromonas elyakovii]TVU72442.1 hypothetical protein FQP81_15385 [Pseudoalteromonas elyakovii]
MRFIEPNEIYKKLPDTWFDDIESTWEKINLKLDKLSKKLTDDGVPLENHEKLIIKERKRLINSQSSLWRAFAKSVKDLSFEKCWYCESREARSNMPVDHFRPKGGITNCDEHPGYWWLAFDWKNYRYSCTYCNSLASIESEKDEPKLEGKGNFFDLIIPQKRAFKKGDEESLPMLLDPCIKRDTDLLTFTPRGFPKPTSQQIDSIDYKRVEYSIVKYRLRASKVKNERVDIYLKLERYVTNLTSIKKKARLTDDDKAALDSNETDIIFLISERAEYRTAARIYLKTLITPDNYDWVIDLLTRN